jgi:hypothetical protein
MRLRLYLLFILIGTISRAQIYWTAEFLGGHSTAFTEHYVSYGRTGGHHEYRHERFGAFGVGTGIRLEFSGSENKFIKRSAFEVSISKLYTYMDHRHYSPLTYGLNYYFVDIDESSKIRCSPLFGFYFEDSKRRWMRRLQRDHHQSFTLGPGIEFRLNSFFLKYQLRFYPKGWTTFEADLDDERDQIRLSLLSIGVQFRDKSKWPYYE